MSTTVKNVTSTKQVLIRDLADLDPKVRNQIPVVAIAIIAGILGLLTGHLTVLEASAIAGPPALALAIAYITTSSHRELIVAGIRAGEQILRDQAPVIEAALPEAAPIIEDAESLAAALSAGTVIAETSAIPTVTPGLPAPVGFATP